jgi:hypothetical protein
MGSDTRPGRGIVECSRDNTWLPGPDVFVKHLNDPEFHR